VDLLTVLMHEMGHVLGLPDLRAAGDRKPQLMSESLLPGTRINPQANAQLINDYLPELTQDSNQQLLFAAGQPTSPLPSMLQRRKEKTEAENLIDKVMNDWDQFD
jgi:hypothetical protein